MHLASLSIARTRIERKDNLACHTSFNHLELNLRISTVIIYIGATFKMIINYQELSIIFMIIDARLRLEKERFI